jgi:hypothetical protein
MSDQDQQSPAPLNAAQLDAIQKRMIAEFQKAVDDVEMRKIALEQAVKVACANPGVEAMQLARQAYAFMLEPAAEIVVKVS